MKRSYDVTPRFSLSLGLAGEQAKDYRGAIALYTQGIEACTAAPSSEADNGGVADPKAMAALYGNRAASYVMISLFEQVQPPQKQDL